MRELGADVRIHDPWVEPYRQNLLELAQDCDAVVLMVAHEEYRNLDLGALKSILRTPVVIDGRRALSRQELRKNGFFWRQVGYRGPQK
jgi:UDP-N-acetyl-D-mannosaminuronate dehydrogenase